MKKRSFLLTTLVAAWALLPLSCFGLFIAQDDGLLNSVQAQAAADEVQFTLVPAADVIADCSPNATVTIKVKRTADELGTDTLTLTARGLRPNATFAIFLTELPVAPFGAVQFLAKLETNAKGKGSVEVNAIIEHAFVSQVVNGQRVRKDLDHVVLWFADPADADACFAPGAAPVTPFDADGSAGPAALSSKNALPGAPLP
ncbi:MAG TPA: hypothetical protein VJZ91_07050 [Blastocatellia bacterium]|nr:hypothetical protein [Blastocatellia bacterium]